MMGLLFLAAASAVPSTAAPAHAWVLHDESEESRFYVDAGRWDRSGDTLKIWLRTEPKSDQSAYRELVTLEEIRCSSLQSRTIEGHFRLTNGQTRGGRADQPFAQPQPGSAWHAIAEDACAMTASAGRMARAN